MMTMVMLIEGYVLFNDALNTFEFYCSLSTEKARQETRKGSFICTIIIIILTTLLLLVVVAVVVIVVTAVVVAAVVVIVVVISSH